MEHSRVKRRDACTLVVERLLQSVQTGRLGDLKNGLLDLVTQMEYSDEEWKQQLEFVTGSVRLGLGVEN